jgi:phosphatidylinositol alpha-1,6-mannosyltransferase
MTRLLISEVFPPVHGGSGRWFWEIYRRLPRDQYLIAAGEHPQQAEFDRGHNLRVLRLPLHLKSWGLRSWTGMTGYWHLFRQLRHLMLAEDVRALHSGRCLPEGFLAWMLRCWTGVPYLVYVHGEDVTTAATSRELSWMVRRVLGRARLVIANSRSTRQILLEQWQVPAERVRLLSPGVDIRRFVPAPRNPSIRRELGWQDRPVVLTVGRLQKRKGHDQMIRALVEVRKTIPEVLYCIIGDGEERPTLEQLIQQKCVGGHVQLMGEVEDARLIRCYQQCDLFALPNRREGADIEGFGMVLLEAQACGRPVLAGDSGGTAETMQVGTTGRIVACDRPEPLAEATADLLSQPQRLDRMGEAGRRWVVEQFDWDALAQQARLLFESGMSS